MKIQNQWIFQQLSSSLIIIIECGKYYDMMNFKIRDEFNIADFAKLVIGHAYKSDLEIQRSGAMW